MPIPARRTLLAALFLTALGADASAQGKFPPDSLVNTTVIPKGTPVPQVIATMRAFTGALGVRCTFCHVGNEQQPLSAYDFASDEKRAKEVARTMLKMVTAINGEHLSQVSGRPTPETRVTCETCHRGVARPVPIEVIVESVAQAAGIDSAVRTYQGLIGRYRDRGAYDFTDAPLNATAQRWGAQGRIDDALRLTAVNDETHPTSPRVLVMRGDLFLLKKDTASAVSAFQAAMKRDSTSAARGRLTQLGKSP